MEHRLPVITLPPDTAKALAPSRQEGEEVLWAERRSKLIDTTTLILLAGGLIMLIIYGMLILDSEEPGKATQEAATYLQAAKDWLLLPGLALCCLLLAGAMIISHRYTTYVLTNRRGLVVENPPLIGRSIHAAAISRDMVKKLTRQRNGTASYMITEQRIGRILYPIGFEGVRHVAELEAQLTRCGVKIPSTPAPEIKPPSIKQLLKLLLIPVLLLCLVYKRATTEPDFFLALNGEQTTATIIAFQPQIHKTKGKGGSRYVTYYHPVLQFRTADGTPVQATDQTGESSPGGLPGDMVQILYDPQEPTIARRTTNYPYKGMAIILLTFLGFLGALVFKLRQLYLYHKNRPKP